MAPATRHRPPSRTPAAASRAGGHRRVGRARLSSRLAIAVGVGLWLVAGTATPAAAHMRLQRSDPASGAVLARSPAAVTMEFNKPVEAAFGAVRVVGGNGRVVPTGKLAYASSSHHRVLVTLSGTLQGKYLVSYRVLSTDGHPIRGSFRFTVRAPAAAAGHAPASSDARAAPAARTPDAGAAAQPRTSDAPADLNPSTAATAASMDVLPAGPDEADPAIARLGSGLRLALFVAMILLVGVTTFLSWLWPAGFTSRGMAWMLGIAGTATVFITLASVILQGATAAGLSVGEALDLDVVRATLTTRFGAVAAVRLGLLVVLLVLLAAAMRQAGRGPADRPGANPRWTRVTLPPLLAGVLVTMSLAGHAGTGAAAPVGLTADVLHLGAVSVWLGGLGVLVRAVLPRRDPVELRQVLPRFSRVAFGAVVVVVSTGLVQTWRQVGAIDALLATDYGRLLLAKVTLVVLLVAAGAVSRSIVQHRLVATSALVARAEGPGAARLDPDLATVARLRRSVLVELAIAVAILALTAALVATSPARATESTGAASLEATIG